MSETAWTPEQRHDLLEELVADLVREGGRPEWVGDDSAVVVKPRRLVWWQHLIAAVATVGLLLVFWPAGIAAAGVWAYAAFGRRNRWLVRVTDDGDVEQEIAPRR